MKKHFSEFVLLSFVIFVSVELWQIKEQLFEKSVVTSDIALYGNMFYNTDFWSEILYADIFKNRYGYTTFLNEHFSPTILLLVPIYKLFGSLKLLLFLQVFSQAIAVFLIYYIALSLLRNRAFALLIAAVSFLNPSTIPAIVDSVYGFHHDCFSSILVCLVFIAFIKKETVYFIISLAALLGMKENFPVIGFGLGVILFVFYFFDKDNKWLFRTAIITFCLSILFLIVGLFLVPLISGVGNRHFSGVSSESSGIMSVFVSFDIVFNALKNMTPWQSYFYFFPALLAPHLLILLLPDFISFSLYGIYTPTDWHIFHVTTIIIIATIVGVLQFQKIAKSQKYIIYIFNSLCIISFLLVLKSGYSKLESAKVWSESEQKRVNLGVIKNLQTIIPSDAKLFLDPDFHIHFANRDHYDTDLNYALNDYFLINNAHKYSYELPHFISLVELKRDGKVDLILDDKLNGVFLYKKK